MKVYKILQSPECTTNRSAFSFSVYANSKLPLETYFPGLNMLWLPPTPKHKYTHRKHYDSLSEYILGVTASKQKVKDTDWEVKGATTLWLKLQQPNFLTEPDPAFLNQGETTGKGPQHWQSGVLSTAMGFLLHSPEHFYPPWSLTKSWQ